MTTSREILTTAAENFGFEIRTSALRAGYTTIVLSDKRSLQVAFDRAGRIRSARISFSTKGKVHEIRPATVEILHDELRAAYRASIAPRPVALLTTETLLAYGRESYDERPVGTDYTVQRRTDALVSKLLARFGTQVGDRMHYPTEALIAVADRIARGATNAVEAAHIIARECLRLAANERFAALEAGTIEHIADPLPNVGRMPSRLDVGADHDGAVRCDDPELNAKNAADMAALVDPAADPREHVIVGSISLDEIGPAGERHIEVGKWDDDEGGFVHAAMFTREQAEALHFALGRMLLG